MKVNKVENKKTAEKRKRSFIAGVVILILGMTLGFVLLSLVYAGPVWVKGLVFILYLFIISFLVKTSSRFLDSLSKSKTDTSSCEEK